MAYCVKYRFLSDGDHDVTGLSFHAATSVYGATRQTLELAREMLHVECLDSINRNTDWATLRLMVLKASCGVAEPGEEIVANGIAHWIEEVG